MKNRFEQTKARSLKMGIRFLLPAIFALFLLFFVRGVDTIRTTAQEKQLESLENALTRSIVQCYAAEGFYPPDLEYLKTHYGLSYDESRYWVDYRPRGTNLMPNCNVISLTEQAAPIPENLSDIPQPLRQEER